MALGKKRQGPKEKHLRRTLAATLLTASYGSGETSVSKYPLLYGHSDRGNAYAVGIIGGIGQGLA